MAFLTRTLEIQEKGAMEENVFLMKSNSSRLIPYALAPRRLFGEYLIRYH